MEKYSDVLRKCALFSEIDEEQLLRMLYCLGARRERFARKETVRDEGEAACDIGIVLSGSVQITQTDYFGNRSIVSNVEPSDCFGEAFACGEVEALPVAVTACEECEILFIDCSHILHTCESHCVFHERLIYNLMRNLAGKSIQLHQKLEVVSRRTTREKLLSYLTFQAQKAGSSRFTIPFDRQELADFLQVDRSGLSTEIGRLRREGLIENNRREFILLDQPHSVH